MSNSLSTVDLGGRCQLWLNPDLYDYLFVRKFNGARRSSSSTGGFLSLTQLQASNPVVAIEETIPTPQIDDAFGQNPTETRIPQRSTLCLMANSNEALQQAHKYLIDHAQRLAQTGPDARTAWDSIVPLLISPALQTDAVPAAAESHVSRHSSFSDDSDVNDIIVIDDADNDEPDEAPSSATCTQPDFSYDMKVVAVSGAEGSTSSAVGENSSTSVTSSSVAPIGVSLTVSEPSVFPPASKSPSGSDNANNNRNCTEPSTSAVDTAASLASTSSKAGQSPMAPSGRVLRSRSKGGPSSVSELHNSSIASSTRSKFSTASTSHASRAAHSSRSDTLSAALEDSSDDSLQSADYSYWLHSMKQTAVSYVGPVSPEALVLSSDRTQFFDLAAISKRERVKPGGGSGLSGRRPSEGKQPEEKHSDTKAKAKSKAKGKAKTPVKGAARQRSRSASSKSAQSDEEKQPAPRRLVPYWQESCCPHKKSSQRSHFCPACYKRRHQWLKQVAHRKRASPTHSKSIAAPSIKLEDFLSSDSSALLRSHSTSSKSSERRQSETRMLNETAPVHSATRVSTGRGRGGRRGRPPSVNRNRSLSDSRRPSSDKTNSHADQLPDIFQQMNELERSAHPTNPEEDEMDDPMAAGAENEGAEEHDFDASDDSSDEEDSDLEYGKTKKNKKKAPAPAAVAAASAKPVESTKSSGAGANMRELLRGKVVINPFVSASLAGNLSASAAAAVAAAAAAAADAGASPAGKFTSCDMCNQQFSTPLHYHAHLSHACVLARKNGTAGQPPAKKVRLDLNSTGKASSGPLSAPLLGPYVIPKKSAPSNQPSSPTSTPSGYHIPPAAAAAESSSLMDDAFPVTPPNPPANSVFHLEMTAASSGTSDNCSPPAPTSSPSASGVCQLLQSPLPPPQPQPQLSQTSTSAYGSPGRSSALSSPPLPAPLPDQVIVLDSDPEESPETQLAASVSGSTRETQHNLPTATGSRHRRLSSDSSDDGVPSTASRNTSAALPQRPQAANSSLIVSPAFNKSSLSSPSKRTAPNGLTMAIKQSPTIPNGVPVIGAAPISQQEFQRSTSAYAPPPLPAPPRAPTLLFSQNPMRPVFQSTIIQSRTSRLMQAAAQGAQAQPDSAKRAAAPASNAGCVPGAINSPQALQPIYLPASNNATPLNQRAFPDTSAPPFNANLHADQRDSVPFKTGMAPRNGVPSDPRLFQQLSPRPNAAAAALRQQQPQPPRAPLMPQYQQSTLSSNLPPASNMNAMPRPAAAIASQYGVRVLPPPPNQPPAPQSNSNIPPPRRSAAEGVRCPVAGCDYSSLSQLVISAHLKVAHKDLPNELLLQMSLTSAAAPAFAAAHGDWKPPVPLLPAPPHTRIDSLP